MKAGFFRLGIALCGLACALPAKADTLLLAPVRDNSIYSNLTTRSNGAGSLYAGRVANNPYLRRALIAFDLSALPLDAVIISAQLTLPVERTSSRGPAGAEAFTIHQLQENWGEGASFGTGNGAAATTNDATWSSRFYHASTPVAWTTAGGTFAATESAIAYTDGPGDVLTFSSLTHSQMLLDLQLWQTSPSSNFGWLLKGDESLSASAKVFFSREAGAFGDPVPQLAIVYSSVPEVSRSSLMLLTAVAFITKRCSRHHS